MSEKLNTNLKKLLRPLMKKRFSMMKQNIMKKSPLKKSITKKNIMKKK